MTRHGLAMKNHTLSRYRGGEQLRAIRVAVGACMPSPTVHTHSGTKAEQGISDDHPTRGDPTLGGHPAEATERRPRAARPPEDLQVEVALVQAPPRARSAATPLIRRKGLGATSRDGVYLMANRPNQTELEGIEIPETSASTASTTAAPHLQTGTPGSRKVIR